VLWVVRGGAALVAAALLRSRVGYVLGWIAQVAGLALGLLTPMMFIVGTLFAAVWCWHLCWVSGWIPGWRLRRRAAISPRVLA
jgi:hypothetical protein